MGRSGVFTPRRAVCPGQGPGRGRIGLHHARPQLFIDTFQIPERTGKKKHKPNSNANNTKPKKSKKLTAPKAPVPKRTPLTPEARREIQRTRQKENRERAKSLEICRHCGEPAIEGQTRCKQCAEKHRISRRAYARRAYDGRRHAAAKQHKEDLRGGPTVPPSPGTGRSTTGSETSAPSAKSTTAAVPRNSARGPRSPAYAGTAASRPYQARPAASTALRITGGPAGAVTPTEGQRRMQ